MAVSVAVNVAVRMAWFIGVAAFEGAPSIWFLRDLVSNLPHV